MSLNTVKEIKEFIKKIEGTDPEERNKATLELTISGIGHKLYNIYGPGIVDILLKLLHNHEKHLRYRAWRALKEIGDERSVEAVFQMLSDSDEGFRCSGVIALGELGGTRAIGAIINILDDQDYMVRREAAKALFNIGGEKAIKPLINLLSDSDGYLRSQVAGMLGKIRDSQAVIPLIKMLRTSDRYERECVAKALGEIGDARAIEPLIQALSHYDSSVRNSVADALAKFKDDRIVMLLIKVLDDEDHQTRRGSVEALGKIGDAQAEEPLGESLRIRAIDTIINILDNPREYDPRKYVSTVEVRKDLANALCNIGGEKAIRPLIKLLSDSYGGVRSEVAGLLGKIGDSQAVIPLIEMLRTSDCYEKECAAKALGEIGDVRAIEPLIQALGNHEYSVRNLAAEALAKFKNDRIFTLIIKILDNENYQARCGAVNALGKIGDAQAVEPLIQALGDSNLKVREEAASALGLLGDRRAIYPLVDMLVDTLGDSEGYAYMSAIRALRKIDDPRAIEPLIKAMNKTTGRWRDKVAEILMDISRSHVGSLLDALNKVDESTRLRTQNVISEIASYPDFSEPGVAYAMNPNHLRDSARSLLGKMERKIFVRDAINRAERYTKVNFPKECHIGEAIKLSIQLTLQRPLESTVRQMLQVPFRDYEKTSIVSIEITTSNFKIDETRKQMRVPIDEGSEIVCFNMTALQVGKQVVEVEFFWNAMRIGYFGLEIDVLENKSTSKDTQYIVFYEDPSIHLDLPFDSDTADQITVDKTLHVNWDGKSALTYSIYYPSGEVEGDWTIEVATVSQICESLSNIAALISDIANKKYYHEDDRKSCDANMLGVGTDLYERVIPEQIREKVQTWQKESVICISTNEQWVPWELLADENGFWGHRFLIFRMPRLKKDRPLNEQQKESLLKKKNSKAELKKIVHVIGGSIKENYIKRAKDVFKSFPPKISIKQLEKKNLSVLMEHINNANLLHFTCHGYTNPCYLQISEKDHKQLNLLITSIRNKKFQIQEDSIIFANACNSTTSQVRFGEFMNFGWEFCRKGAAIFIGTLSTVSTEFAIRFAEIFYRSFLSNNGSIKFAFLNAKRELEKEDNFFYLLYCLYGNPVLLKNYTTEEE